MIQAIGVQKTSGTGITVRSDCDLKVLTWTNTAAWSTSWISSPTRKRWWRTFGDKTRNDTPGFAGLNSSIEHFGRIVCQSLSERIKVPTLQAFMVHMRENGITWAASRQELQQAAPSSADNPARPLAGCGKSRLCAEAQQDIWLAGASGMLPVVPRRRSRDFFRSLLECLSRTRCANARSIGCTVRAGILQGPLRVREPLCIANFNCKTGSLQDVHSPHL